MQRITASQEPGDITVSPPSSATRPLAGATSAMVSTNSWSCTSIACMRVPIGAWRHSRSLNAGASSTSSTAFRRAGDSGWLGPGSCLKQSEWV